MDDQNSTPCPIKELSQYLTIEREATKQVCEALCGSGMVDLSCSFGDGTKSFVTKVGTVIQYILLRKSCPDSGGGLNLVTCLLKWRRNKKRSKQ
eukprot:12405637-Ditylum_brightwellii.AAC.1